MTERTFDRRVEFDEASRQFPIRTLVAAKPLRSYTWGCAVVLDQGTEGACVGFGWAGELAARPSVVPDVSNTMARGIYAEARTRDEWPGEDYSGTSVLAGAKVIQARGFMREYRWAFGLTDLLGAIGHAGPAVLGINWYAGMEDPDPDGFLHVSGPVEGGHAILAYSVSVPGKFVRVHNSWGDGWGNHGNAKVSWSDLERLLDEDGEACVPIGRTRYPNPVPAPPIV